MAYSTNLFVFLIGKGGDYRNSRKKIRTRVLSRFQPSSTLLRKRNQTLFHFSYLGKIKRAQLALSNQIRGKIVVFVVSRTLVSLPPSAGPPLDLGLAMAAPRVSLLLIAHSMRCFAPPSASMMPFICSVVLQDPPLGDGLFAPTVTPEVGGSSTKAPRHPSGLHLR